MRNNQSHLQVVLQCERASKSSVSWLLIEREKDIYLTVSDFSFLSLPMVPMKLDGHMGNKSPPLLVRIMSVH
jgi:hypothetical protein